MGDFLSILWNDLPWQIALALMLYWLFLNTWKELWKSELSRERWIDYLYHNHRYRSIMGGVLDWIDARLTPEIVVQGWKPTELRCAWSHNLLGLLLVIALAYPMFSLFAIWVYTGDAGRIGTSIILPAEPNWFGRYAPCILMVVAVGLAARASSQSVFRLIVSLVVLAVATFWSAILVLPDNVFVLTVGFGLIFGLAWAAAAAAPVGSLGAVACASAVGVTILFADLAVFGASSGVEGTIAVVLATAFAVGWIDKRTGKPTRFLLGWAVLGLVATLAAISFGEPGQNRIAHSSSIILFVGILPLLNAIADFASTGLTRYYLRQGIEGSPWLSGLKDFLGGAAIFTLLVTAMMAICAWVHWPDGTPLLDLGNLLADIRANPGDYWWLYFTFLTTLLPTLLHLGIALFATVFEMSPALRSFIVNGLTEGGKGDDPKGRWALRALCLSMTVALMLPIMVFGWIIQYHGLVGTALLDMFEGIACWAGMLPGCS